MDGGQGVITLTRPSYYDAPRYADYCGSTTTLFALTGVVGWEATKGAKDNSLYLNNKSDVTAVDVYIAAIGAGSAI